MATKEEYAHWCYMLMEGDTHMIGELFEALREDGFVDDADEWTHKDEDE